MKYLIALLISVTFIQGSSGVFAGESGVSIKSVIVSGAAGLDYAGAEISEAYESSQSRDPSEEIFSKGKGWKVAVLDSHDKVLSERYFDFHITKLLAKCRRSPCPERKVRTFNIFFDSKGEITKVRLYRKGKLIQERNVEKLEE